MNTLYHLIAYLGHRVPFDERIVVLDQTYQVSHPGAVAHFNKKFPKLKLDAYGTRLRRGGPSYMVAETPRDPSELIKV